MPKEIYRSLLPGEPEPKIKRRVGTSFSISDEMIGKQSKVSDDYSHLNHFLKL